MADPTGFLRVPREERRRVPAQRLRDWCEVHLALPEWGLRRQAGRCMGCGIPFCHEVGSSGPRRSTRCGLSASIGGGRQTGPRKSRRSSPG